MRALARPGIRELLRKRIGWGVMAVVGYILSPLSWWNDAIVNIPIAFAAAKLLERVGVSFVAGFYIAYTLTNIAGMVMLIVGGKGALGGYTSLKDVVKAIMVAVAYSIAVYPLLNLLSS